jgi:hypothetical protein
MVTAMIALMFIPIVIGIGYAGGTDTFYGDEEDGGGGSGRLTDWTKYEILPGAQIALSDYADQDSETVEEISVPEENVLTITFTLTWEDEPDTVYGFRTYENQGDSFTLSVVAPDNSSERDGPKVNEHGEPGEAIVEIVFEPDIDPYLNGTGNYQVTIECGECQGSFSNGPIGFADNGNDWELTVEYEYYSKEE